MKTIGLVGAVGVTRSCLARMPALLDRLGPVKGSPFRVSRRIANGLRAGEGVAEYAAMESCQIILICVPEARLDTVSLELAAAIRLAGKTVVLSEVLRDSLQPSPLRTAGARVATLNCMPETDERGFIAEGHAAAVSELRRLLALDQRKLIELLPATKPLYLMGLHMGTHLLLPRIAAAVESLRAAGFTRTEATRAVSAFGEAALRGYDKTGAKAWKAAAAERMQGAIARDLAVIRQTDPRLAALFLQEAEQTLRFFAKRSTRAAAVGRVVAICSA